MRIFSSIVEAVKEVERDLVEMGISVHPESMQDLKVADNPDFETKELNGYSYCISPEGDYDLVEAVNHMDLNAEYIGTEMNDRLSNKAVNPGRSYLTRSGVWEKFLHNGKFSYTYSERMFGIVDKAIEELRVRPNSRQVIIPIYHPSDSSNWGGKKRIPCSMYYQAMIRPSSTGDKLNLIYTMRSCDYYTHYGYDVLMAIELMCYMAEELEFVTPGKFTHFIGSLHAYKKDYSKRGIF